jgi:hypothetical protein
MVYQELVGSIISGSKRKSKHKNAIKLAEIKNKLSEKELLYSKKRKLRIFMHKIKDICSLILKNT